MLFRTDVYFTEYFLAVEIDEKGHTDRPYFWGEKTKSTRKKLGCKFIRIANKEDYNAHYEASRVRESISKFKDKQFKKLEKKSNKKIKELEGEDKKLENESNKKIKELEDEIKKLKLDWQVKLPNRNKL